MRLDEKTDEPKYWADLGRSYRGRERLKIGVRFHLPGEQQLSVYFAAKDVIVQITANFKFISISM